MDEIPEDIWETVNALYRQYDARPSDKIAAALMAERERCRLICIDQAGRHAAYKSGKAEADAARACAKVIMGADPFEAYPGEQ